MEQKRKVDKRKVWDIVSWILVGILFIIAAFGLFLRFRRNQVYFFGKRYDAVLSKSMATVNEVIREDYEEKGWTNQFKKGSLLVSTKITEETELKAGDIVIFINPDSNKITAHRIVSVGYNGNENVYTIRADAAKPGEEDGGRAFLKNELQSKVVNSVPFFGYLAGYITSFWGIMAEAGIIVIFVVYELITSKKEEKEKSGQIVSESAQSLPLPKEKAKTSEVSKIEENQVEPIPAVEGKKLEEVKVEEQKVEAPPVVEEKKPAAKKPIAKKTFAKSEVKKAINAEPEKTKTNEPKKPVKEVSAKKDTVNYRNYHVVKRSDGKWEVKYAGGQKAIKLFDTQKEAVEYSNKMAKNQDGVVLVHNSKGKNKGRIKSK